MMIENQLIGDQSVWIEWEEREYIDPFHDISDFWLKAEHLGRYLFAANFLATLPQAKPVVLDAGCGSGYGSQELSKQGALVLGLDRNEAALEVAKNQYGNGSVIFDAFDFTESLPLKLTALDNSTVDMVVAFEFLEHLDNPGKSLSDFYQVLKPGGYLLTEVPNEKFEPKIEDGLPENRFHKQLFDDKRFTTLLVQSGFVIQARYGQALTNRIVMREFDLFKQDAITLAPLRTPAFRQEEVIRYFSYLLAYPDQEAVEESYSMIFVSQKPFKFDDSI